MTTTQLMGSLFLSLAFAAPSLGQATTSANAQAATSAGTRTAPQSAPEEGSGTDDAMSTSAAYQRTGGSLMRASRGAAVTTDPNGSQIDPRMAAVSFYAVPPPKPRVIQPRDLITIIIKEQSEFKSDGETKLDKNASLSAAINQFISLNLNNASLKNTIGGVTPKIDVTGKESFDGKGSANRTDSVSVRLQAEVVDVKPNGNLVLSARRHIKSDDEDRVFLVSGTARVADVTTDNTVLSTQLSDFDLQQLTKGTVHESTHRGWLPRLLDAINPF